MPPFKMKGDIWLIGGILLKVHNTADGATAKLDGWRCGPPLNEGRHLTDRAAPN